MTTEHVTVTMTPTGRVRLGVEREEDGIIYRAAITIAARDASPLASALERFAARGVQETMQLTDGELHLFTAYRSTLCNMELRRAPDHPEGSYDGLDLEPGSLPTVIAALRGCFSDENS